MEAQDQIQQIREILDGQAPKEIKRSLELIIRKLDAIEIELEKKIDQKFEEQAKLICSLKDGKNRPPYSEPEEPWFYS